MTHDLPTDDFIKIVSYADDITIMSSGYNVETVKHNIQNYLNKLTLWLNKWQMKANPQKTMFQIYSSKRNIPSITLKLSNTKLQMSKEQRVLGITFDAPKCTFTPHFTTLKQDCKRRLHVMRALSSTTWGCSRKVLHRVYIAYVRSKMEYGSVLFTHVNPKQFQMLDVIQNEAMRCILGARKTSPILSLQVESSIPPIKLRFESTFIKWSYKIKSQMNLSWILDSSSHHKCSIYIKKCEQIMKTLSVPKLPALATNPVSPIEPWVDISSKIKTEMDISNLNEDYSLSFNRIVAEQYPDYNQIYTDGSKYDDMRTSAAFYSRHHEKVVTFKLNPGHSILGAELYALQQALIFIKDHMPQERSVIFCDSQAALHILCSPANKAYRTIAGTVQDLLKNLENVKLQWVKAHVGIKGNEVADRAAHIAHNNNLSERTFLNQEEIHNKIQKCTKQYWTRYWKEQVIQTNTGSFLSSMTEEIADTSWIKASSRQLEKSITRLRIGHVGLNKHLFRFEMADSPQCRACSVPETVEHFLLICPSYQREREKILQEFIKLDIDFSLKNVLCLGNFKVETLKFLMSLLEQFLKKTGRISQL